ncbi:MAG: 2-alkenal reductase, partial [Variovorax sp.]|nr:2-alkenal reductase [Variovorax sp.]
MKRTWLLFAQTVTVLLAAYFVVVTLKPEWLQRRNSLGGVVSVVEAPGGGIAGAAPFSLSAAAKKASPAVVSINTSKGAQRNPRNNDPWFRFFFGDQGDNQPQVGLGSGVIVSADGYILTNNHV